MNTNRSPLVSIIIPFYNHNHFIKQTLDSIKEDTYENKEIIIINDGSPNPDDNNIVKWINSNQDIQVRYIKRENKGLTKTLNELIDIANGDYILLCASDDYLINNTIETRVAILENRPDKMVLISDNIVVDNDSNITHQSNLFEYRAKGNKHNYFSDTGLKKEIINRWALAGPCFLAKKEVYSVIGKYDESLIVEDWDFFLRAVAKDLVMFFDEKVSAYRIHGENTILNPHVSTRMYQDQLSVAKKNIQLFKFPHNLYLFRRYIKFYIKLRKISKSFPYNSTLWAHYDKFKRSGCKTNKAILKSLFFMLFLYKKNAKTTTNIRKLLITRYDRIGDMVLTFPLIEILKRHNPQLQIDIYASDANCVLAQNNKHIDKVYVNTKHSKINAFMTLWRLRRNNYDLAIDMYENRLSNTIIRLNIINAKQTIGLDKYRKHGFSNQDLENFYTAIYGKDKTKHIIEKNLEVLDFFNITDKNYTGELFIPHEYEDFYTQYTDPSKKNIVLNTEGSEKERTLNIEQITEILQGLDLTCVNVILPATQKHYEFLKKNLTEQKLTIVKVFSIYQTISLIKNSDLVISPDTSIIHFASMLNKKIIGIYSANEPNFMANHPFSKDYKVVRATSEGNTITTFNTKEVIAYAQEFLQ